MFCLLDFTHRHTPHATTCVDTFVFFFPFLVRINRSKSIRAQMKSEFVGHTYVFHLVHRRIKNADWRLSEIGNRAPTGIHRNVAQTRLTRARASAILSYAIKFINESDRQRDVGVSSLIRFNEIQNERKKSVASSSIVWCGNGVDVFRLMHNSCWKIIYSIFNCTIIIWFFSFAFKYSVFY